MRIMLKLLSVVALATAITACPAPAAAVGKLEVKITGLPTGVTPSVSVTGPGGFNQAITSPGATNTSISNLPVGSYKIAASDVTANSVSYTATVTGSPANVTADATLSASVVYAVTP
jgi:hypothetical protein